MSKDKKSKNDVKKKETPFYFETIGFASLILVIIIFGRLGKIGNLLNVAFMVIFGDWYWLFVLFILFYGVSNILTHKNFNFKSQKFIGYMIFCCGLLVFSHFSVHRLVVNRDGSYFQESWTHYKMFLSTGDGDFVLGGGVVGGVIFFLVYYLLGVAGVVLVAFIVIILGTTMMLNKSIVELSNIIFGKIKKVGKFSKNFNNFFRYEVGKKKEEPPLDIYSKDKLLSLKILDTYQNEMNFKFQEKESYEIKSLIISVFNTFNIEYREISVVVSYAVTTFKYFIYSTYDYEKLQEKLQSLLEVEVIIGRYNNNVFIEVPNKFVSLLTIKNALIKQPILNTYQSLIGVNSDNEFEEINLIRDGSLLVVGQEKVGIKTFIYYFVCSMFMKISIKNYEFELYDQGSLFGYKPLFKKVHNGEIMDYLESVITYIDETMKTIQKSQTQDFDEYNQKMEVELGTNLRRKFVIVNLTTSSNHKLVEDKLLYIIQMGRLCGVHLILISRNLDFLSTVIISIIKTKMIFKLGTVKESLSLINDSRAFMLKNKGEFILMTKDRQTRVLAPLITNLEIDKIIKAF